MGDDGQSLGMGDGSGMAGGLLTARGMCTAKTAGGLLTGGGVCSIGGPSSEEMCRAWLLSFAVADVTVLDVTLFDTFRLSLPFPLGRVRCGGRFMRISVGAFGRLGALVEFGGLHFRNLTSIAFCVGAVSAEGLVMR